MQIIGYCDSQVSVFLDGSFACTSQLKQTNPGESFTLYLGADTAFKAEYLPCRSSVASNWLSSTKTKTFTYTTILHNTKVRYFPLSPCYLSYYLSLSLMGRFTAFQSPRDNRRGVAPLPVQQLHQGRPIGAL